jgi:hypothetical protein
MKRFIVIWTHPGPIQYWRIAIFKIFAIPKCNKTPQSNIILVYLQYLKFLQYYIAIDGENAIHNAIHLFMIAEM